jgi:hypothetical protein
MESEMTKGIITRSGLTGKTVGDKPWEPLPPVEGAEQAALEEITDDAPPLGTKENPYYEGGFSWWVEGEAPHQRVMCSGVGVHNSEYPDFIWNFMCARDPDLH